MSQLLALVALIGILVAGAALVVIVVIADVALVVSYLPRKAR